LISSTAVKTRLAWLHYLDEDAGHHSPKSKEAIMFGRHTNRYADSLLILVLILFAPSWLAAEEDLPPCDLNVFVHKNYMCGDGAWPIGALLFRNVHLGGSYGLLNQATAEGKIGQPLPAASIKEETAYDLGISIEKKRFLRQIFNLNEQLRSVTTNNPVLRK